VSIGPKVIRKEAPYPPRIPRQRNRDTGIRQANDGSWNAIRDGALVSTFNGKNARFSAIRAAGTSQVLA
jgi:hypothetical protein